MSSARVFTQSRLVLLIAIFSFGLGPLESTHAQGNCTPPSFNGDEQSWRAAYISWCTSNGGTVGNYYDGSGTYTGWGCHPGANWKCGGSSATSSTGTAESVGTAAGNAMVKLAQTYQQALEAARAHDAALRDAATAANNNAAASASRDAESSENQAQDTDLATYRARKASQIQSGQDAFASAHASAGAFLDASLASPSSDSTHATPAQQRAWKQLHCLAYVSRIAFVDLALNDITDYHDTASEASKALNGSTMDVSCPAAPLPDLDGKNNVDMNKVSMKLKSDLDQAAQIAQHMEKLNPQQINLPAFPPDVAADPKLVSAWKVQQAINAINDAPNPGKTPQEFTQVLADRDKLRQSLGDANNAANGNFGSIQVDLGSSAPSSSSSGTPPQ